MAEPRFNSTPPPTSARRYYLWLAVAGVLALHLWIAAWHVSYGKTNPDEGFYAIATRGVAQGEMPYRDFGFTQPPFVLYANALPLKLTGFGLVPLRSVNGAWALGGLVLAAWWCARRTTLAWALGLVVLFSINAPWMYYMHLGKTYGLTTFFVAAGAWVFLGFKPGGWRQLLLGLFVVLGTGTRLTAAPFFVILWLLALWPGRRPVPTEVAGGCAGLLIFAGVLLLPFWWLAPEQMRFWIFDFHLLSVSARGWSLGWQEVLGLGPGIWLLTGFTLSILFFTQRWKTREAAVLAAALITLAVNLLPQGAYDEYGTPFLLPLGMAACGLLHDAGKARVGWQVTAATLVFAAQLLVMPALNWSSCPDFWSRWLTPRAPTYSYTQPEELAFARETVLQATTPETPFIGPCLLLAAETGRPVPRELYMGPFALTAEMTHDRAERLHLATREKLDRWFDDPNVTVIVFYRRMILNYGWSMPSFARTPDDEHLRWFEPVMRQFEAVYMNESFVVLVRKRPS